MSAQDRAEGAAASAREAGAPLTVEDVKRDARIQALIRAANHMLEVMGYTEHGLRHMGFVSSAASGLLRKLGRGEDDVRLAAIAGMVHDVGNAINRQDHGIHGALLLYPLLGDMGMPFDEVLTITQAVGNHDEETGVVCSDVGAALIIADKIDAHRTRVRRKHYNAEDIHDRVNNAITKNEMSVDAAGRVIRFEISMDATSSIMEFFEIYLGRMQMCQRAARHLGCRFELVFNGVVVNNQGGM